MKMKKQNLKNTLDATKYMFASVWKKPDGKKYVFLKLFIAVLDSILPLVYAIFPGLIIDELLNDQRLLFVMYYIIALCSAPIINEVIHVLLYKKIVIYSLSLELAFSVDFYSNVADMDFELNESPEIQALKRRAQQTIESSVSIVDSVLGLISAVIRLISISAIVITLNPIIMILVIIQVCINAYIEKILNDRTHEFSIQTSLFGRKIYANTSVFDDNDYAKELRLYNLKDHMIRLFIRNKKEEDKLWQKHRKNQFQAQAFKALVNNIQQFIVYTILAINVLSKVLSIGQLTIYLASVSHFSNSLELLFSSYVNLYGRSLKIDELVEFLKIPRKQAQSGTKQPHFTKDSVIEFKNVSFKYPGSDNYALKNLNIKVKCSEKLCIVGANGSGKTTFVKLLTRLYLPTEGDIFLDGVNINEYDYKQYQNLFAPVFQDFQLLFMSLRENVVLAQEVDNIRLEKVYRDGNLDKLINSLKYSDNTQVYKWECADGFEPSGGEGQKIAIARAIYHDRPVYILDEPTAALDPTAEYEMYEQFHKIIQNKTAILITHRLSAVQLADIVAVFDNGHIEEYGTHSELYAKGGIYKEMFDKQSEFYVKAASESNDTEE